MPPRDGRSLNAGTSLLIVHSSPLAWVNTDVDSLKTPDSPCLLFSFQWAGNLFDETPDNKITHILYLRWIIPSTHRILVIIDIVVR